MKTSFIIKYAAKLFCLMFAVSVVPLFSAVQSNKVAPPPPAPRNSAPPAPPKPVPPAPRTPSPSGGSPHVVVPGTGVRGRVITTCNDCGPDDTRRGHLHGPVGAAITVNGPHGGKIITVPGGPEARYDSRGQLRTITAKGMTITHGPGGTLRVVTENRGVNNVVQSRIVSTGSNRGYVEHAFQRGGHEYMRRTYVYRGRTYVNVYRGSSYHGVIYYHYIPVYYYHPMFYGWAYNPWPGPVYYAWGWNAAPWYGAYGYYFTPYPAYSSAAFWLTDYMLAESLSASFDGGTGQAPAGSYANDGQASSTGPQAQNNSVTLTPEVKQMIAEEVKAQLAAEQAAATQTGASSAAATSLPQQVVANAEEPPAALDPSLRIFIVSATLDVQANDQPCSLSAGDVLMRTENTPDNNNSVGVSVVSSKRGDCNAGSSPRVEVADLQEMHNHFREQMDSGLKTLADNQGKNGLPASPAAHPIVNPDGQSVPDLTAVNDLQKQKQDAAQAEREVQQASLRTGNGE